MKPELSKQQHAQEVSYQLPYHYATLMCPVTRLKNNSQFSRYNNVIDRVFNL